MLEARSDHILKLLLVRKKKINMKLAFMLLTQHQQPLNIPCNIKHFLQQFSIYFLVFFVHITMWFSQSLTKRDLQNLGTVSYCMLT